MGNVIATHSTTAQCDGAALTSDESRLFVVDRSLSVWMFAAPAFAAVEGRIVLNVREKSSAFVVKSLTAFENSALLVQYGPEGLHAFVKNRYIYVDMVSKLQSVKLPVTSISTDCNFETMST